MILQSSSFYDVSYHLHSAPVSSKLAGLLLSHLGCEGPPAQCLTGANLTDLMRAALKVESDTDNWGWEILQG